jgi:excisionase family DNA binding protein
VSVGVRIEVRPKDRTAARSGQGPLPPNTARQSAEPILVYAVKEVAARLKVSEGTVRNMIDERKLYALRLPVRRIVVPKWALDDRVALPKADADVTPLHRPASNA